MKQQVQPTWRTTIHREALPDAIFSWLYRCGWRQHPLPPTARASPPLYVIPGSAKVFIFGGATHNRRWLTLKIDRTIRTSRRHGAKILNSECGSEASTAQSAKQGTL
jgi:hypothetical protein